MAVGVGARFGPVREHRDYDGLRGWRGRTGRGWFLALIRRSPRIFHRLEQLLAQHFDLELGQAEFLP
jgi:hypothetical protein